MLKLSRAKPGNPASCVIKHVCLYVFCRMVYTECRSSACSVQCSNQRMQRHDWVTALQKFPTEGRGYGVKTKELVPAGESVCRLRHREIMYAGSVLKINNGRAYWIWCTSRC